jgi:hypothetical protein
MHMGSKLVVIISLAMISCLSAVFLVSKVEANQSSITVIADSYVKSIEPDANYGTSDFLNAYNHEFQFLGTTYTASYSIWLKFDLSEIPSEAKINSITLRLHTNPATSGTTNRVGVFICDNNSWTESKITWNNAPTLSTTQALQIVNVSISSENYDFNLTSALKGKSEVTLVLKSLQSTAPAEWTVFDSKEKSYVYAPELIVNYSNPYYPIDFGLIAIIAAIVMIASIVLVLYLSKMGKKKIPEKQPETLQSPW